jgi:anti-sigma28 factor (negative regulator of flagellin synthesis)
MINPIQRGGFNLEPNKNIKNIVKKKEKKTPKMAIIVELNTTEVEDINASKKVETLKKLIRVGKYPLNPKKVADKLLNFLTDVG